MSRVLKSTKTLGQSVFLLSVVLPLITSCKTPTANSTSTQSSVFPQNADEKLDPDSLECYPALKFEIVSADQPRWYNPSRPPKQICLAQAINPTIHMIALFSSVEKADKTNLMFSFKSTYYTAEEPNLRAFYSDDGAGIVRQNRGTFTFSIPGNTWGGEVINFQFQIGPRINPKTN